MVTTFPGARCLRVPVTTPVSTSRISASDSSSVWTPRSRWSANPASRALGIEPIPAWMVAPSGMRSATKAAIRWSIDDGADGAMATNGRSTSVQPVTWLTCTWLRPNVRGIRAFTSRKNGTRPMNGAA